MAHKHSVYDSDTHLRINPTTRTFAIEGFTKNTIVQYDHNSERFTFELPRVIEGHDMLECNSVQVHYLNVDAKTQETSSGVFVVTDLQESPDDENIVIFSWLISSNATKYVGSLNFCVRFACISDENTVDYAWNTAVNTTMRVTDGINNAEIIIQEYADVLEQWKAGIVNEVLELSDISLQADWKETDENSPTFVKNKTHSVKTSIVKEALLDATLQFDDDGMNTDYFVNMTHEKVYAVTWGEDTYNCTCREMDMGEGMIAQVLGNMAMMGQDDTGEPFVMASVSAQNMTMIIAFDGSTSKVVKIVGEIEKKDYSTLDINYLPDNMNYDDLMFYIDFNEFMPQSMQERIMSLLAKGVVIGNENCTLLGFKSDSTSYRAVYIDGNNNIVVRENNSNGKYRTTKITSSGRIQVNSNMESTSSYDTFKNYNFEVNYRGVPVIKGTKENGTLCTFFEPHVLKSPNGTYYQLKVDDNGNVSTNKMTGFDYYYK